MLEYNLSDQEFKDLRRLVFELAGISMGENKRHLLKSRLQRRLRALSLSTFAEYCDRLRFAPAHDPEIQAFVNAVTTNKTDFFRERHHFEFVARRVIPDLILDGRTDMRIWHAGCSTGEEPYTLGMTLLQLALPAEFKFKQLASDIDTGVLAHAEAGVYAEERVDTVPPDLLHRWFLKGSGKNAGTFRVKPLLQEHIVFRRINLVQHPWPLRPDTVFDVIFCRNVLIYFDRETQRQLVRNFFERLNPGGYLMLGHSESIGSNACYLENVGQTIYRRPLIDADERSAA